MIWYDARTGKPIAPGEGEDGGPPSMEHYYCYTCGQAVELIWKAKHMLCAKCRNVLLKLDSLPETLLE